MTIEDVDLARTPRRRGRGPRPGRRGVPQRPALHDRRPADPPAHRAGARGRGRRRAGRPGRHAGGPRRPGGAHVAPPLRAAARSAPPVGRPCAPPPSGRCPPAGCWTGRAGCPSTASTVHHFLGVSCFAERAVLAEESVIKIPDGTPPTIAALIGCAVVTGVGAVLNVLGSGAGRSVLVMGAGGVGLSVVLGARLVGALPDRRRRRRPGQARAGPHAGRDAHRRGGRRAGDTPVDEAVRDVCPDGVDWAFDAVGKPSTVQAAMAALRTGGTTVAIGLGARRLHRRDPPQRPRPAREAPRRQPLRLRQHAHRGAPAPGAVRGRPPGPRRPRGPDAIRSSRSTRRTTRWWPARSVAPSSCPGRAA